MTVLDVQDATAPRPVTQLTVLGVQEFHSTLGPMT